MPGSWSRPGARCMPGAVRWALHRRSFVSGRSARRRGSSTMAAASDQGPDAGTLRQGLRRDFSGVCYDEAMRRAREILPILRERAQKAEDARMLIRENEQLLHEAGLFRFHQPKAFGGMELEFVAVVDIPAEIARGCPSTAWNVGNLAC